MTQNEGVRGVIEAVVLLFVAATVGLDAVQLLVELFPGDPVSTGIVAYRITPPSAVPVALVGGVLAGLHLDDTSEAVRGAAIGCAVGFLLAVLLHAVAASAGTDAPLEVRYARLAVDGVSVVIVGVLAALAPSRL